LYNEFTKRVDFLVLDHTFTDTITHGRRLEKVATHSSGTSTPGPSAVGDAIVGGGANDEPGAGAGSVNNDDVAAAGGNGGKGNGRRRISEKRPLPAHEEAPAALAVAANKKGRGAGGPVAGGGGASDSQKWATARKERLRLLSITTTASNILNMLQTCDSWGKLNSPGLVDPLVKSKAKLDGVINMGDFFKTWMMESNFQKILKSNLDETVIAAGLAKMEDIGSWATDLEKQCNVLKGMHTAMVSMK